MKIACVMATLLIYRLTLTIPTHPYTRQINDGDTGLSYYNTRYYDPALHRFIQADTIVPDPIDPQTLNR